MPQAYVKPGVSVSELVNPSFQPVAGETTDICIIGVGAGFTEQVDVVQLLDNSPVELSVDDGIDLSNLVVTDYADPSIVYARGTTPSSQDFYITGNTIQRSLRTAIPNGAQVVVVGANNAGAIQETVTLDGLGDSGIAELVTVPANNTDTIDNFQIQLAGRINAESNDNNSPTNSDGVFIETDTSPMKIRVIPGSTSIAPTTTQTVYVDYIDADAIAHVGRAVILNGATAAYIGAVNNVIALTGFSGTDNFKLTYNGVEGATVFTRGGNYGNSAIQAALRTATGDLGLLVTGAADSGFTITFSDSFVPLTNVTVTSASGCSGTPTRNTIDTLPAVNTDGSIVGLVVRNVNDASKNEQVVAYTSTSDSAALTTPGSGNDVTVVFDDPTTPTKYDLFRPDHSSTIPNGSTVRVVYTATASDYFLPTRCFSLQDVESKYGAGLAGDSDPDGFAAGTVKSPVSFAAQLAFLNGAPSVVIQTLYSQSIVSGVTFRFASTDPGTLADWTTTLQGLRIIEDINLIVPIIATNGADNGIDLSVFTAVQNHIDYMIDNEFQFLQAIFGEDSTFAGQASAAQLRTDAKALGARVASHPEAISVISPAAYKIANPVTGLPMSVGGQYIAAALAGSVAGSEIQASLTRHPIAGVVDIIDSRTEADKDTDAKAGLLVIESRRGVIQVRHGLTVAVNSGNTREFSVIRAKHYMIESIRTTLDDQVVGQIVADSRAAFTVQLLVEAVLEQMVQEGVIVTYSGVTASLSSLDPTTITVGFEYLPAFPLNYVQVQFSINTATNTVTTTDIQG